ncbi:twin-arginine translocation pathway signal [Pseudoponticoccus marisrubri]|uniref:Twin-arginine translocation pathway signal n=2 Tax=Pseudoponticoccus marisrubri TaxID=1685382 RepID=A0A0W7WQD7_9RHOB|nr:twin-arginine translocation pathway signal [Pseudoponticoccus marisrubri]
MRRRAFLSAMLASATMPGASWADAGSPAFLAAAREPSGAFALFGLSATGQDLFRIPLPARGHAAAAHPVAPEAVAFARRPGAFALVIDCASGQLRARLDAPAGRHFYGHGAYLDGGEILVTSENGIETGAGVLGLWARSEGYRRIGEIPSGGVGPHEILALPGEVLAVANGGIRTHPERGRDKLNLASMRPNLAYVSLSGGIEEVVELEPDLHHASIRHLAAEGGQVAFAMQWQGDLPDPAPLLGLHRRGAAPVLCSAEMGEQMSMDGYAGSVAMDARHVAITSPRGGRVHVFDRQGRFVRAVLRADVCGIATGACGLVVTDGQGGIAALDPDLAPLARAARAWDNHLVRLGG